MAFLGAKNVLLKEQLHGSAHVQTRELKQTTTATATRTSPNKRFNERNNSSARAFEVLAHFLAVLCNTTT